MKMVGAMSEDTFSGPLCRAWDWGNAPEEAASNSPPRFLEKAPLKPQWQRKASLGKLNELHCF